jgi:general stress protein 26
MMGIHSPDDTMTARPMSNNGAVKYKGDSYFFAYQNSRNISPPAPAYL